MRERRLVGEDFQRRVEIASPSELLDQVIDTGQIRLSPCVYGDGVRGTTVEFSYPLNLLDNAGQFGFRKGGRLPLHVQTWSKEPHATLLNRVLGKRSPVSVDEINLGRGEASNDSSNRGQKIQRVTIPLSQRNSGEIELRENSKAIIEKGEKTLTIHGWASSWETVARMLRDNLTAGGRGSVIGFDWLSSTTRLKLVDGHFFPKNLAQTILAVRDSLVPDCRNFIGQSTGGAALLWLLVILETLDRGAELAGGKIVMASPAYDGDANIFSTPDLRAELALLAGLPDSIKSLSLTRKVIDWRVMTRVQNLLQGPTDDLLRAHLPQIRGNPDNYIIARDLKQQPKFKEEDVVLFREAIMAASQAGSAPLIMITGSRYDLVVDYPKAQRAVKEVLDKAYSGLDDGVSRPFNLVTERIVRAQGQDDGHYDGIYTKGSARVKQTVLDEFVPDLPITGMFKALQYVSPENQDAFLVELRRVLLEIRNDRSDTERDVQKGGRVERLLAAMDRLPTKASELRKVKELVEGSMIKWYGFLVI